MKYVHLGPMVLAGIVSASCGTTTVPNDKAVASEAAVRSAEEVGARDVPQAAMYLDLAQKEVDQGKGLMKGHNYHDAALTFDRAQADASVASALAREERTRVAAEQTRARAQAMRQSIPGAAVGGGPTQPGQPVQPNQPAQPRPQMQPNQPAQPRPQMQPNQPAQPTQPKAPPAHQPTQPPAEPTPPAEPPDQSPNP